jgi:hypothetical protein
MARRNPAFRQPSEPHSIGPSDSSDSGSDLIGIAHSDDTSDRNGTGERTDVENDRGDPEDIDLDRVVGEREAGLGGGLDQAEEAQLGITDEEIESASDEDE